MDITGPQNKKQLHLAGIIPVAGREEIFRFPWPDCMMPISNDYLAIERSVEECAYAGCKTIWIVVNDDEKPILKHRVGSHVRDPSTLRRASYVKYPQDHYKDIPVFYVPIHPKDRDRRDSLGWSVLHGALTSFIVGQKISKWVTPNKYYVSFPQAVYDPSEVSSLRGEIQGPGNVFVANAGLTVVDGQPYGFTMTPQDYKNCVKSVKKHCTGGDRSMPAAERWSSRHFGLDKIFNSVTIEDSYRHEIEACHRIDDWQSLLTYYRSDVATQLTKNSGIFKKGKK